MPVAPQLQRFVDDELGQASQLAEQARVVAVAELQRSGADARAGRSPAEALARREAATALTERAGVFGARFRAALGDLVRADLDASARPAHGVPEFHTQGLALLDEAHVEADIEVSRAAMQIDSAVEWEQRELQTFTSALRGEAFVGEASNPIRPASVARALWQASESLALTAPARLQALRACAGAIGTPLKAAFAAACTRLEAQGVTPSQYRSVVAPPGSALDGAVAAALAARQAGGGSRTGGALHSLLDRLPEAPVVESTPPPQVLVAAEQTGVDARLVELITRLFETLLGDPGLAEPARRAIGRLQGSALRVALRDPSVLDSNDHPTWRLLDRIAAACQAATAAGPQRLDALGARCERFADDLARHAAPDAMLHRQGLARLEALIGEDLHDARQAMRDTIESLQRSERRRQVQAQVQQRMQEQFTRSPVGPATRHWLLSAVAQQIAESMLQDGADSAATAALTRNVDDLLWSLHPPEHPASRQRLVKLLPGLIGRMRAAMAQGGVSPAEEQAVLAEMEAAHRAALWPAPGAAREAETPEEIVRRLREETFDVDAAPRREFGDSVLDLSTLDTVPASLMPDGVGTAGDERAERERRAQAAVAALAPGRAVRLLLQCHWHDAQLLWRSADAELLLFAGRAGQRHALTRRALERLHAEGLALLDAPGSLVQRAVDALRSGLFTRG